MGLPGQQRPSEWLWATPRRLADKPAASTGAAGGWLHAGQGTRTKKPRCGGAKSHYRLMARRDPVGIRLITRRGNDWTTRYPLVVEAVNHLKVRSCLIEGEVRKCFHESSQSR